MCLDSVGWQGEPLYHNLDKDPQINNYPLRIWKAWKVFADDNYGQYYGGPYEIGKWYLDANSKELIWNYKEHYELGFHAYKHSNDAISCMIGSLRSEKLLVRRVLLMGIKATGRDYMGRFCYVADWMMLEP